jgi:hypothetical protein
MNLAKRYFGQLRLAGFFADNNLKKLRVDNIVSSLDSGQLCISGINNEVFSPPVAWVSNAVYPNLDSDCKLFIDLLHSFSHLDCSYQESIGDLTFYCEAHSLIDVILTLQKTKPELKILAVEISYLLIKNVALQVNKNQPDNLIKCQNNFLFICVVLDYLDNLYSMNLVEIFVKNANIDTFGFENIQFLPFVSVFKINLDSNVFYYKDDYSKDEKILANQVLTKNITKPELVLFLQIIKDYKYTNDHKQDKIINKDKLTLIRVLFQRLLKQYFSL